MNPLLNRDKLGWGLLVGEKTKIFNLNLADVSAILVSTRISIKAFNGRLTVDGGEVVNQPFEEKDDQWFVTT